MDRDRVSGAKVRAKILSKFSSVGIRQSIGPPSHDNVWSLWEAWSNGLCRCPRPQTAPVQTVGGSANGQLREIPF